MSVDEDWEEEDQGRRRQRRRDERLRPGPPPLAHAPQGQPLQRRGYWSQAESHAGQPPDLGHDGQREGRPRGLQGYPGWVASLWVFIIPFSRRFLPFL